LQNEPKFQKVKLNVNKGLTKEYEQMDTWSIGKNEPKTNPNEPKTNPIKANKMPKQTQYKAKQTQFQRKKSCSPLLCCGIYKEKMIFCNLINRQYQID
jgi:hypothetical protein